MVPRLEIGIDAVDLERLAPFWAAALGYAVGDLDADGVYLDLVPPDGANGRSKALPIVYLQRVAEAKQAKNRVHLDLMVTDPPALIDRLVALGARALGEARTGASGGWWQVMADPEGNEFCVCREYDEETPP